MAFLSGKHAFRKLGAAGEAVGKIQRLRNHDARIAVGPVCGRGTLESDSEAEFERGKIAVRCAFVVRIAHGENLARKDARLGARPCIGYGRLRFENGENDGVTLDEYFLRRIAVQKFPDRLVQVQAEMRSGVEPAREQ